MWYQSRANYRRWMEAAGETPQSSQRFLPLVFIIVGIINQMRANWEISLRLVCTTSRSPHRLQQPWSGEKTELRKKWLSEAAPLDFQEPLCTKMPKEKSTGLFPQGNFCNRCARVLPHKADGGKNDWFRSAGGVVHDTSSRHNVSLVWCTPTMQTESQSGRGQCKDGNVHFFASIVTQVG